MASRTVILSDLHLGRPDGVRTAAELDGLIEPDTHLVLNGDTAELHHPRWRSAAREEYEQLLAIARERRTTVTTLAGNHDPEIASERMLLLGDGEIMVTHGDAFHPAVAPWSVRANDMRGAWNRVMAGCEPSERDSLSARFRATQAAATAEWSGPTPDHTTLANLLVRPLAVVRIAAHWWLAPTLAARFARQCGLTARILIVGHSHWPGIVTRDGRSIVNTGAFTAPRTPHAAIVEGASLALVPIIARSTAQGRRFVLGGRPRRTVQLNGRGSASPAFNNREGNLRPSAAATPWPASMSAARSTPVASPDPSQA